jgi:hypothetical protein
MNRPRFNRFKYAAVALLGVGLLAFTAGCTDSSKLPQNDPQARANYEAQTSNVKVPVLTDSLERRNVSEHLTRNNAADRIRYIYLLADTGGIYAYFVIKGKVSSTASQLTPTDDWAKRCDSCGWELVQGAGDDGTFGGDEGGIYFFTDTGMEVQWNGRWLLTDQPLVIKTPTLTLTTS